MENFRPQPVVSEFESWSTDEVGGTLYPELDRDISDDELGKAISALKSGKAVGEDQICTEMIKYMPELRPLLLKLFNRILQTGDYPKAWATGLVVPLYKKGDQN